MRPGARLSVSTEARKRAQELERFGDRERRKVLRARLTRLKRAIRELYAELRRDRVRVRSLCRASRRRAREAARRKRVEALAWARAERVKLLEAADRSCRARAEQALRKTDAKAKPLKREIEKIAKRLQKKEVQGVDRDLKRASQQRQKERLQESDDEVIRNIEPELVPIFEQVSARIQPTAKRSRTESFLHWVEENPDEVEQLVIALAERDYEKIVREQVEQARRLTRLLKRKGRIPLVELERADIDARDVAAAGLDPQVAADLQQYFSAGEAITDDTPF